MAVLAKHAARGGAKNCLGTKRIESSAMKKLILLALCLLLAFYVGWPMWSAYKIHAALEANDAKTLETKVDFPSVRESLKPTITSEVERAMDKAAGGVAGQIVGGVLNAEKL